jgi:hypothetical protein
MVSGIFEKKRGTIPPHPVPPQALCATFRELALYSCLQVIYLRNCCDRTWDLLDIHNNEMEHTASIFKDEAMEAVRSSKTLVSTYKFTRHLNPENHHRLTIHKL